MNETEKLDCFLSAIYADGEAERQRIIDEIERKRTSAMDAAEHDALQASYEYMHNEILRVRAEQGGKVSQAVATARRTLSSKQDELTQALFARVEQKILAFTAQHAYETLLSKQWREAKQVLGEGDITLYLREEDLPLGGKLFPGVTLQQGDFRLGGFVAVSKNRRIDASLDTAMKEAAHRFAEEVHP